MRDIKFRGKRTYGNHDWVFGSFVTGGIFGGPKEDCYIFFDGHFIEVIPETVGQLTPLAERDGKDVYEGDTVKFHYFFQSLGENLGVQESEHELIGNIVWGEFGWAIDAIKGQHWEGYTGYHTGEGECSILELYSMNQSSIHEESFEVIGNIHDVNPAVQDSVIINMNIDPNVKTEEVKEQPADAVTPEQATDESAEEGTTEG